MITKWVAKLIEKYSFIKKAEIKGVYLELSYRYEEKDRIKKVSIRANKEQLQKIIESIKHDTNYYEDKRIRDEKVKESMSKDKDKPMIVANV
jgi:hypothetical protein